MTAWQITVGLVACAFSACTIGCVGLALIEDRHYDCPEGAAVWFAGFAMFGVSALAMWSEALR